MKSIKKILSGILAVSMCMSAVSVSATQSPYYKGDINNDGFVNSSDLVAMLSFLNGTSSASGEEAERLDLSRNYIIDNYDCNILKDILLEHTPLDQVTSEDTTSLPIECDVVYRHYSPSGTWIDDYTVKAHTSSVSTIGSTRGIIGSVDSRNMQSGMNGVLKVQTSDGDLVGTAFVVDSHTILTAGHVLYNQETNALNRNLQFKIYNTYNTVSNEIITAKAYHIPLEYCIFDNSHFDYAIVTVTQDLSNYINFDLGVMRSGDMNEIVNVTGFGGRGKSNDNVTEYFIGTRTTGVGNLVFDSIYTTPYNDYFINYDADEVEGDSGGPVWVYNYVNNTRTVIGINVAECYTYDSNNQPVDNLYNIGIRINTNILNAVFNNEHLLH